MDHFIYILISVVAGIFIGIFISLRLLNIKYKLTDYLTSKYFNKLTLTGEINNRKNLYKIWKIIELIGSVQGIKYDKKMILI